MTGWINFSLFLKHMLIDDCAFPCMSSKTKLFISPHPSPPANKSLLSPLHLSKWYLCPLAHIKNPRVPHGSSVHSFVIHWTPTLCQALCWTVRRYGPSFTHHCLISITCLMTLHQASKTNSGKSPHHCGLCWVSPARRQHDGQESAWALLSGRGGLKSKLSFIPKQFHLTFFLNKKNTTF